MPASSQGRQQHPHLPGETQQWECKDLQGEGNKEVSDFSLTNICLGDSPACLRCCPVFQCCSLAVRAWGECWSKCAFTAFPNIGGTVGRKGESEFCLALKSQLEIPEPGFCTWCKGIRCTAPLHPNQIPDSKTPTMSENFDHILKTIICSSQTLTSSFPVGSLLKWHHQQRSQSSLPDYGSLLQGDTLRKQAHLLISSVFMFQKPGKEENQTSSKKQQEPFHCVPKFMANTVTE